MRPMWLRSWTMVLALLALSLFGCSRDPLRPVLDESRAPSGMGVVSDLGDTLALPSVLPGDSTRVSSARDSLMISVTEPIDGLRDAVMTAGRVRLEVPCGAIRGTATIELKTSPNGHHVQLEILPADRNGFDSPVRLSTNCSGVSPAILKNMAFFWIDPVSGDWVLVEGSTVDMLTGEVSAPLMHFSEYRIGNRFLGKAGW